MRAGKYARAGIWLLGLLLVGCGAVNSPAPATALPTVVASGLCANARQPLDQPIIAGIGLDLWMLDADRASPTQITALQPGTIAASSAWSPDRTMLAYSLSLPPSDPLLPWLQAGIICGFDTATGQGRTLARSSLNDVLSEPSWAADSKSVVVTRRRINLNAKKQFQSEEVALVRYDLASGGEQVLVQSAMSPALSPNGQRLVYVSPNRDSGFPALMIANSDGSNPQALGTPEPPFKGISGPRWSPDGTQLVFSARGGPGAVEGALAGEERSWWARWFAAGTASAHGEPGSLWVVQSDGTQLRPLIDSADDPLATWNPADNTLLYADWTNGLMRYDPATGSSESVGTPEQYWLLEWASH
jgi:Tol biopolymer transport system component